MYLFVLSVLPLANNLTLNAEYEQSIKLLSLCQPSTQVSYLMAVNYYALNNKEQAAKWIAKSRDSFAQLSRRQDRLLAQMEFELSQWNSDDLMDIERDMRIAGNRLGNSRSGPDTQQIQKQIVNKLDKLIEQQENKAKGQQAKMDPEHSPIPAPDSEILPGVMGGPPKPVLTETKLRQIAEQWGSLPPAKRELVMKEITQDLPVKYKQLIEVYFEQLNRKR